MITVTKTEHQRMVDSAESALMVKMAYVTSELKKGGDIRALTERVPLLFCNLLAVRDYETGPFDPCDYFNVQTPADVSRAYSNTNIVNTKK